MVTNKQKKVTKQRGRRTHGYGLTHRGSGRKGGKGRAGGIKKSNCKKRSYSPTEFGRHGFKIKNIVEEKVITTKQLDQSIEKLLEQKKIKEEKGKYLIDLSEIGYDKLISNGKVYKKLEIKAKKATDNAIEKIQNSEGTVIIQNKKE